MSSSEASSEISRLLMSRRLTQLGQDSARGLFNFEGYPQEKFKRGLMVPTGKEQRKPGTKAEVPSKFRQSSSEVPAKFNRISGKIRDFLLNILKSKGPKKFFLPLTWLHLKQVATLALALGLGRFIWLCLLFRYES